MSIGSIDETSHPDFSLSLASAVISAIRVCSRRRSRQFLSQILYRAHVSRCFLWSVISCDPFFQMGPPFGIRRRVEAIENAVSSWVGRSCSELFASYSQHGIQHRDFNSNRLVGAQMATANCHHEFPDRNQPPKLLGVVSLGLGVCRGVSLENSYRKFRDVPRRKVERRHRAR